MKLKTIYAAAILLFLIVASMGGQVQGQSSPREKLLMDFGWRFALGHAYDTKMDFDNGSGYFCTLQKRATATGPQQKILMTAAGGFLMYRMIGAMNFHSTASAVIATVTRRWWQFSPKQRRLVPQEILNTGIRPR